MSNFLISTRSTTSISDSGPQRLEKLKDCLITNPLNNQQLVYESSKGVWRNSNIGGTLTSLSDVEITDPIDYNILTYYNDKWINTKELYGVDVVSTKSLRLNSIDSSYKTIDQSSFTGGAGTSLNPSFYHFDPTYTSISIDASFISEVSSYFIKLPTTLENGSVIYIQVTKVGSQGIGIMGGATVQDNLYINSNQWVGYLYAEEPKTYTLTYYAPSSNNPWYGNTNFTANSWRVESMYDHIRLKPYSSVYGIDTMFSPSKFILPFMPSVGQIYIVKDISGNASVSNITIDEKIDEATAYVIKTNYECLTLICTQSSLVSGTKFIKINGGSSATLLSLLTDCTVSNPTNNQVLQYNSTMSKWTNATLTAGSSTLKTLTDVSITTPSNDQVLVFTDHSALNKWTPYTLSGATFNDTNKTITISGTTALSGLTTDVAITLPIATNSLLIYSGTSWVNTSLTLSLMSEFNISSPALNDILYYDGTKWINSSILGTVVVTAGPKFTDTTVAHNDVITPTYSDGTSGTIMYSIGVPFYNTISAINCYGVRTSFQGTFAFGATNVYTISSYDFDNYYDHSAYTVYNIKLANAVIITGIRFKLIGTNRISHIKFACYASNNPTIFNLSSWNDAGMTFLGNYVPGSDNSTIDFVYLINNSTPFQYVHIYVSSPDLDTPFYQTGSANGIQVQSISAGYNALVSGTNFTIATDAINGYPQLTYTDASTIGCIINETSLLVEEAYRRLFPVVRDANTIRLTDGTNTATLTSTSIISTHLKSATTNVNVSSATAPTAGQVLTATSSTTATWQPISVMSKHFSSNMLMVPFNTFTAGNYTILGLCNHYVFNCTGVTTTNTISLISVSNGTKIQMQFNNAFGSGGNYNIVVGTSGATNFYTSNQVSVPLFNVSGSATNNTYTFTYYGVDLNPWRTAGDHAPSWTVTTNSINAILFESIDLLYVFTANDTSDSFIALSNPQQNQDLIIRDITGYINVNNVVLVQYGSCTYNSIGGTSATSFTCDESKVSYHFVYTGTGYYLL